jgi:hypothetical protein
LPANTGPRARFISCSAIRTSEHPNTTAAVQVTSNVVVASR